MSNSRDGQDLWVLATAKNKYYVDIGAADGIRSSNTFKLEKEGRHGICVEPVEYEQLNKNRECIKVNKAVWNKNEKTEFLINVDDPQLSGIVNCFCDSYNRYGLWTIVETITLNDLLEENNAPINMGYLNIDTEGSEYEILEVFDFTYSFDCITVEHNFNEEKRIKIRNLLTQKNYKFYKEVNADDWYTKDKI